LLKSVLTIRQYKFALAAFLIPLGIRTIPEIIVGPYPVGWDTIAFYVPSTLDLAAGRVGPLGMLGGAPLMYMISLPVYLVSGVNPIWIFKVMGPGLYGCMAWALYRFLRVSLSWPGKQALGGVMLSALYFVTLRIGWDLYRNMLGMTFILLSLPFIQNWKGTRRQLTLSCLLLLAVASDQLTATIALVLVAARAVDQLRKRNIGEIVGIVPIGITSVALFSLIVYAGQIAPGQAVVQTQPALPGIERIWSSLGFPVYAFLPLLPFAVMGIRRTASFELRIWSVFCVVAIFATLFPFYGLTVESYRWVLLLDIPVCVFAASGLRRVRTSTGSVRSLSNLILGRTVTIVSLGLLLSSLLYIAMPAQQAFTYYTMFPNSIPTSMVQDSVPLSDMASLRIVLNWVAARLGPDDALITHQAIYGWARVYLPSTDHIINYGYSSLLDGVTLANSSGYSNIFVIWWTPGLGWHGQSYLPNRFGIVFANGNMAAYAYQ